MSIKILVYTSRGNCDSFLNKYKYTDFSPVLLGCIPILILKLRYLSRNK